MTGIRIHSLHSTSEAPSPTRRRIGQIDPRPSPLPDIDETKPQSLELEAGLPGVHAPWSGLRAICAGCGAPSVSGLGSSGTSTCEYCSRGYVPGGFFGVGTKEDHGGLEKGRDVAVTSAREISLGDLYVRLLLRTGLVMVGASGLLLVLLLVAW